ncbi:MAG: RNA polymerase subunit sigma-70 [Acidimicrobiales bacterium]
MSKLDDTMSDDPDLGRARAGEGDAFGRLTEPYRAELRLHCYRMLGSLQDAEDALQETMLSAWRGLDRFEERAFIRAWLYRIATNRCLNMRRSRARRRELPSMPELPTPTRLGEVLWLEPYPDPLLEGLPDRAPGPEARYELREATELAFITALQRLPPRQRAALVLRDVLGFRLAEVAAMLDAGEASVKGALQRGRAAVASRLQGAPEETPKPRSTEEGDLVRRLADAVESGDVAAVLDLLTDDAWLTMPPQPFEYQGRAAIALFLQHRFELYDRLLRVVVTRANTQPALGCYLKGPGPEHAQAYGLLVVTLAGQRISAITWFAGTDDFSSFGLPLVAP